MSKRPRGPNDDEAEIAAKRMRQDLEAMHERWAELAGYPSILLPEIHRLIGYKLTIKEMVKIFETSSHFTLEKNPTFHIALWSTLVDVEFRSPFTGEPYRMVKHFRALLERVGSTMSKQDMARFWRAAYSRCHMAVRAFLIFVMMRERVNVEQSITGVQRDILPERWRHLLSEEWLIEEGDANNDDYYNEPLMTLSPGDRLGLLDVSYAPGVGEDWPAQYNVLRNNWLCLADETRRTVAQGDMFRWTPEGGVLMVQSQCRAEIRRVQIHNIPATDLDMPNEPRSIPPSLVDEHGKKLSVERVVGYRLELNHFRDEDPALTMFEYPRMRCVTDVVLQFPFPLPGDKLDHQLRGKAAAPGGLLHFVTRSGRTVMSGNVYGDYWYEATLAECSLLTYYGFFVHRIDMDAYIDWLVERTPADQRGGGLISLIPEPDLTARRDLFYEHDYSQSTQRYTRRLSVQLDAIFLHRIFFPHLFRDFVDGMPTIEWLEFAIWNGPFDDYLQWLADAHKIAHGLAEQKSTANIARLLVAWMTQPGAPLVHFAHSKKQ